MENDLFRLRECRDSQKHVHEIVGSTRIAERCDDPHNHRFATVSGEAMPSGLSHVHEVKFRTDFYEDHFHDVRGTSSQAIPVSGGKHVHFIDAQTMVSDGHRHELKAASLIDNPIGD